MSQKQIPAISLKKRQIIYTSKGALRGENVHYGPARTGRRRHAVHRRDRQVVVQDPGVLASSAR